MKFYTHILGGILLGIIVMFLLDYSINLNFIIIISLTTISVDLVDLLFFKKHERYSHSLLILIIPILIFIVNRTVALGIFIGLASHLLLDIITSHGCPLFYPFSKIYVCFNEYHPIRSGTKNEKSLASFMLVLIVVILLIQNGFIGDLEELSNKENSIGDNFKGNINLNIEGEEKEISIYSENNVSKIKIVNIDSESDN